MFRIEKDQVGDLRVSRFLPDPFPPVATPGWETNLPNLSKELTGVPTPDPVGWVWSDPPMAVVGKNVSNLLSL